MLEQEGLHISMFMRQAKMEAALFLNRIGILILPTGFFPMRIYAFYPAWPAGGIKRIQWTLNIVFLLQLLNCSDL